MTKAERHKVYKKMLFEIDNPTEIIYQGDKRATNENGLCWMYMLLFDHGFNYDFSNVLPELAKYEISDWWSEDFPTDWGVRKKALKQCIKETKPNQGAKVAKRQRSVATESK